MTVAPPITRHGGYDPAVVLSLARALAIRGRFGP
jgi:hypothetical protein